MNDNELDSLIRQSQPQPAFSAFFQREVWARIAIEEQQSWATRWQQFIQWIAQPAPALATVTLTLGLGIGLGNLTAPSQGEAMRLAYVVSINPIHAAHAAMQP